MYLKYNPRGNIKITFLKYTHKEKKKTKTCCYKKYELNTKKKAVRKQVTDKIYDTHTKQIAKWHRSVFLISNLYK